MRWARERSDLGKRRSRELSSGHPTPRDQEKQRDQWAGGQPRDLTSFTPGAESLLGITEGSVMGLEARCGMRDPENRGEHPLGKEKNQQK